MNITTSKKNLLQNHVFFIGAINHEGIFHWHYNPFSIGAIFHWAQNLKLLKLIIIIIITIVHLLAVEKKKFQIIWTKKAN